MNRKTSRESHPPSSSRRCRTHCACIAAAVVALSASTADAQPASNQTPEELFADATKALEAHDYAAACPKFAEVVRMKPGKVGAMLALAQCYESAGKTALAREAYANATEVAEKANDSRAARAKTKMAELEANLSKLTIRVPDSVRNIAGLEVRRNGEIVPAASFGALSFVSPGDVEVTATAPGKKPFSTKLQLVAAGASQVDITFDDLSNATVAPGTVAPQTAPPTINQQAPLGPTHDTATPKSHGSVPTWAWITGGVGVVSTGLAIGFLADQAAAQSTADANCFRANYSHAVCDPLATRLHRDYGLWIGFGAVGVVGLGAATVGIVTGLRGTSTTSHSESALPLDLLPTVSVGPNGAFLTTRGTF